MKNHLQMKAGMVAEDLLSLSPDQRRAVGVLFGYTNAITTLMVAEALREEFSIPTGVVMKAIEKRGPNMPDIDAAMKEAIRSSLTVEGMEGRDMQRVVGRIAEEFHRYSEDKG